MAVGLKMLQGEAANQLGVTASSVSLEQEALRDITRLDVTAQTRGRGSGLL